MSQPHTAKAYKNAWLEIVVVAVRLLVVCFVLVLAVAHPAAGAPAPRLVTPPGLEQVNPFFELFGGAVHFQAGFDPAVAYRAGADGQVTRLGDGLTAAGEAAAGVVVQTRRALSPADEGGEWDLYLLPPAGAPVLLSGGLAKSNGFPRAELASFTPDGRGVVFMSPFGTGDGTSGQCSSITIERRCDLHAWRDGVFHHLDEGEAVNGWVGNGAQASDDLTRFIATGQYGSAGTFYGDPMTAIVERPDGGRFLRNRILRAASADLRSAIVAIAYDDYGLFHWDGVDEARIGPEGADVRFVGASPDLERVLYTVRVDDRPILHVQDAGGSRRLLDAPVLDEPLIPSADATQVLFTTSEALVGADTDGALDAYVAGPAGVELATPGTTSAPRDVRFRDGAVAFATAERLGCDDLDDAVDLYVTQDGTARLATAGAAGRTAVDVGEWQLAAGGEIVFHSQEALVPGAAADGALYRVKPGGAPDCGPKAAGIRIRVKGRVRKRCAPTPTCLPAPGTVRFSTPRPLTATLTLRRGPHKVSRTRRVRAGTSSVAIPRIGRPLFKPRSTFRLRVAVQATGSTEVLVRSFTVRSGRR